MLEALTAEIGEDDVLRAKRSLMAEGYAGWAYGRPVAFWVDELLLLASGVLRGSDAAYLEPLEAMTRNRFTLADAYQDRS